MTEVIMEQGYYIDKQTVVEHATAPIGYSTPARPIHLLDETGNPVPPGGVGEIAIQAAFSASAYWRRPDLDARRALEVWRHDRGRTASPNAGHPMAAMAGALGVRLEKRGDYLLGATLRPPVAADVDTGESRPLPRQGLPHTNPVARRRT